MPVFYLDASAIVKRYRSEEGTDIIDELTVSPAAADRFYTSFLSILEVTSAIHRAIAPGQLDQQAAHQLVARFRSDLQVLMRPWPLSQATVTSAVPLVERHRLRSADAIHLATALAIASAVSRLSVIMVSSDRELLRAARADGLSALDPVEEDALIQLRQLRR